MNFAHLHLILTHFPPVLSLGGAAAAAVGVLCRRRELIRLALLLMIAIGAMMPVVYVAGDRAADSIGKVEGVQQEAIAPHQRAATVALASSVCVGLIAGALLLVERRRGALSPAFARVALAVAIASAMAIGWTASLGGAIHHPEIRGGLFSVRR
jgi:hypothetical protein